MHSDPGYHLRELAVAQAADDPRRAVPEIPPGCERILDVGCGAGQTLWACATTARRYGVDFDQEALRLGKHQVRVPAELACSSGEYLPFRDASFDFAFSRVALPYMDIARAVAELHRVLHPGGHLWLTLHPLSMLSWGKALGSPRRTVYELYRLANTALLHFTGRQFAYPLRRSRMESYQTEAGMRRVLERAGFGDIRITRGRHFLVQARKP